MKPVGVALVIVWAVLACSAPVQADLRQASGKLTLLRVHDVGTKYGPPSDQIDVEVVIHLHSQPGRAFGFQLREDGNRPAHQGMLDLLRDAFNNDWPVTVDYDIEPGKQNGVIIRAWLTKPQLPEVRVEEVPNVVITADDPILRTGRLDPAVLTRAPPPPEFRHKGAHALMKETKWLPVAELELGPGQSHQVIAAFDMPSLILASATWVGSPLPVELTIAKDGATVATGKASPVPPDQGTVEARAEIAAAGSATVSVKNPGRLPVSTQIVVGMVALSLQP